jgi:hypothetical protein
MDENLGVMDENEQEDVTAATGTTLTSEDIVAAATNSPALAKDSFVLNGKTYKVVDLDYDSYMEFLLLLQPLLEVVLKIYSGSGSPINLPSTLSIADILKNCLHNLPQMVLLICRQTDLKVTMKQIKQPGNTPFTLAEIVMKQIVKNNMIKEFTSFFGQIAPLMN